MFIFTRLDYTAYTHSHAWHTCRNRKLYVKINILGRVHEIMFKFQTNVCVKIKIYLTCTPKTSHWCLLAVNAHFSIARTLLRSCPSKYPPLMCLIVLRLVSLQQPKLL